MAPVKRSGGISPRAPGRPAKAAKVLEPDRMQPFYDLLSVLADVPPSVHEMLRSSVPHALSTLKGERHEFQVKMLESLAEVLDGTQKKRETAIGNAEAAITEHQEKQTTADTRLIAAKETEEKTSGENEVAKVAVFESQQVLVDTKSQFGNEQKIAADIDTKLQSCTKTKTAFATEVTEAWVPSKEATFAPKEWRQAKKAVARVLGCLEQASAPTSLADALQVAFKENVDSRSKFGVLAVEHCEKVFEDFVKDADAQIAVHEKEVETQQVAITAAEEVVTTATTKHRADSEAATTAEGTWHGAVVERKSIEHEISDGTKIAKGFDDDLVEANKVLADFKNLFAQFAAFRDAEAEQPAELVPVEAQ